MSQHEKEILGNMGDFIDRRWTLTLIKKKTQGNLALIMTRQTLEKKRNFSRRQKI